VAGPVARANHQLSVLGSRKRPLPQSVALAKTPLRLRTKMTAKTEQADRRAAVEQGWHLDKKVPLSLIFAMLVQAGMVIVAISEIKKDVEVLKSQANAQMQRDNRQDSDMREAMNLLRDSLNVLNMKLDRLIERAQK
jgi:hypothetical protein